MRLITDDLEIICIFYQALQDQYLSLFQRLEKFIAIFFSYRAFHFGPGVAQ